MAKITERGTLIPVGRDENGNVRFAAPEVIMSLMNAFKMPGQVYRGERKPTQEDALEFALNMAGLGQVTRFMGPLSKESGAVLSMNTPVKSTAAPLSEAAQISRLMKANRDDYNMDEFFNFVANKKPGPYYFHSSTSPDLTKDNFDYLSSKIDFDDAHRALFPKGATGRAGAFITEDAANIRALRQQQGPHGPFKEHINSYIFRVNPDKVSPKFQPMRKKYTNDPTVMEGFLPKESITDMEKILTLKNLEDFFKGKKK